MNTPPHPNGSIFDSWELHGESSSSSSNGSGMFDGVYDKEFPSLETMATQHRDDDHQPTATSSSGGRGGVSGDNSPQPHFHRFRLSSSPSPSPSSPLPSFNRGGHAGEGGNDLSVSSIEAEERAKWKVNPLSPFFFLSSSSSSSSFFFPTFSFFRSHVLFLFMYYLAFINVLAHI
jgi:hypothetical protein